MTAKEYMQLLENLENVQALFNALDEVRDVLKRINGKSKFCRIYNFIEREMTYVRNVMKDIDKAIGTDEAIQARRNHEAEIWCWQMDRKEPLPKSFYKNCYDPCDEIYYPPLDDPDYISLGMGI